MRYIPIVLIAIVLSACNTTPNAKQESRETKSAQVHASELQHAPMDSVVQFLLTASATDFHARGPSGPLRFRDVRIGHVMTPGSGKQYRLCGEFSKAGEGGKMQWLSFATIQTSDYEQWIGAQASVFSQDSLMVWDTTGDLSASLQSIFDSLR